MSVVPLEVQRGGLSTHWIWAGSILILALGLRLVFFRGALGSDEVVYTDAALRILHGDWGRGDYVGAIRYGINVPLAMWIALVGYGNVGLGGLYFACSIAEVVLAYIFARHLWGGAAALWSALIVAVLPLNVALGGSLNPDPYLALVIELSLVAFYFAQRNESPRLYFLAGLLTGWIFWVKHVVIIYALVFVFIAAADRRWRMGWLWFALGGFICAAANLALFWILRGDPLFIFHESVRVVSETFVEQDIADTSLWTYLVYLFGKIYHTGLLGWLALAGFIAALRLPQDKDLRFILIWGLGLLFVFSAIPISFSPLKFVPKQTNYMVIFLFPFALLAGWFLSRQQRAVKVCLGMALIGSGVLLSAMEQQAIRIVTANGPTAVRFRANYPTIPVVAAKTISQYSMLQRLMSGSLDSTADIRPLTDLKHLNIAAESASGNVVAYAIEDPQVSNWLLVGQDEEVIDRIKECGSVVELLPPPEDLGSGRSIVAAAYNAAELLPPVIAFPLRGQLERIYRVGQATVYSLNRECIQAASK